MLDILQGVITNRDNLYTPTFGKRLEKCQNRMISHIIFCKIDSCRTEFFVSKILYTYQIQINAERKTLGKI